MRFLTSALVEHLHDDILDRTGGTRGILNRSALDAAIARHEEGPFPFEPDLALRAAFLLRGIAQDHPFADGNKRTAFEAADLFLRWNGFRISAPRDEVIRFMLRAAGAEGECHILELEEIREWVDDHVASI